MPLFKYTKSTLLKYAQEHKIILIGTYLNENLGRDYNVCFKCSTNGCINNGKRCFKNFITGLGALCKECTNNSKINKTIITSLNTYGTERPCQNESIKQKIKDTCIEKYGFENPSQNEDIKNKKQLTSIINFGVPYALQNKDIQNSRKEALLLSKGVENQFQLQEVKDKTKETCIKKFGVEHPMKSYTIRQKVINTCIEKYGFETPLQNEIIKQKICDTNIERYGVPYVSQNKEIMEKQSKNAYKLKDYILPSGNIIKIQGYENYALDELLQDGVLEEDIVTGCFNVPDIWYNDGSGVKHIHYVDIFIPSQNKMIEVKSTWTAEKKKDCIFIKQIACKNAGYLYEIWVYNGKGEKVECYK